MKTFRVTLILFIFIILGINCYALNSDLIYPRKIEASSYLFKNDFIVKDNYHPYYIIDDNPNTAWVEGVSGDGIGEYIIMFISLPKNVNTSILIKNGYQKNIDLFYKNNRVKELEIEFVSGTANNPNSISHAYFLKDEMGWQQIDIKPEEDVWGINFIIRSVYKGTKYEDTCISDIKITFEDLSLIDVKSQETLRTQYTNWFLTRSKKAAFFSNLPKNYPFKAYKKTNYKKNIKEDSCPILDLEYYNRVLENEKLDKFISSPLGRNYLKMLKNEGFTEKNTCNINFKSTLYTPDILSENYLLNVNQYVNLSNLLIKPSSFKPKVGDKYQKVLYIGKNIRAIDWYKRINADFDRLLCRYFYDDTGRLIFIKGEFAGEDGECSNDALFVWNDGKITEIYWFYVQWANEGGLDIQMTVYE